MGICTNIERFLENCLANKNEKTRSYIWCSNCPNQQLHGKFIASNAKSGLITRRCDYFLWPSSLLLYLLYYFPPSDTALISVCVCEGAFLCQGKITRPSKNDRPRGKRTSQISLQKTVPKFAFSGDRLNICIKMRTGRRLTKMWTIRMAENYVLWDYFKFCF